MRQQLVRPDSGEKVEEESLTGDGLLLSQARIKGAIVLPKETSPDPLTPHPFGHFTRIPSSELIQILSPCWNKLAAICRHQRVSPAPLRTRQPV